MPMLNSRRAEPILAPTDRIELTTVANNTNKLTTTTIHLANNDVQSSVLELVFCSTIHDVWWFFISTCGKPGEE